MHRKSSKIHFSKRTSGWNVKYEAKIFFLLFFCATAECSRSSEWERQENSITFVERYRSINLAVEDKESKQRRASRGRCPHRARPTGLPPDYGYQYLCPTSSRRSGIASPPREPMSLGSSLLTRVLPPLLS